MENMLTPGLIAAILVGLAQCFFGYRIFRFILIAVGFLAGYSFALVLDPDSYFILGSFTPLVGGIIGALLFGVLFNVGIFLMGGLVGLILSLLFTTDITAMVIVSVVAGALALVIKKFAIVALTAFIGSWMVIKGITLLMAEGAMLTGADLFDIIYDIPAPGLLAGWVVLGVVGMIFQYRSKRKKSKE